MGKTTSPPISSKEGARRSQPRNARCFTRGSPPRAAYAGSWTARCGEEHSLLHGRFARRRGSGLGPSRAARASSRLGPALVSELGEELFRALLGAVRLRLGSFAAHHHLHHHVRHDAGAVQLGEEGKEVVLGPAEADGEEALLVEAR